MQHALALVSPSPRFAPVELLRSVIVVACAMALIVAGHAYPAFSL